MDTNNINEIAKQYNDGVTDATDFIQELINNKIAIPTGNYLVTGTLDISSKE
jgi:hypothetical protein